MIYNLPQSFPFPYYFLVWAIKLSSGSVIFWIFDESFLRWERRYIEAGLKQSLDGLYFSILFEFLDGDASVNIVRVEKETK